MNLLGRNVAPCLFFFWCATAQGAGTIPAIDVVVANSAGGVTYKGTTKPDGTFATNVLQPGNYVVQFNSTNLNVVGRSQFALVVSAGKRKVSAAAVAGAKFTQGGVAMKIEVEQATRLEGQVTHAGTTAARNQSKSWLQDTQSRVSNGDLLRSRGQAGTR